MQKLFWRTIQQQEIDYIEQYNQKLWAVEIKWNPKAKVHFSSTFTQNYKNVKEIIVTPDNVEDFLQ